MCELFAMSSSVPATVTFSLEEFAQHGGLTGPHKDGWGIAFAEDGDVRVVKDTTAASSSPWLQFLENHPIRSRAVISHIRKRTTGTLALKNTQPFIRELGGRMHTFAHNGHVPDVTKGKWFPLGPHRPVGETDSEYAFCALLARLEADWLEEDRPPSLEARFETVSGFARDLRPLGPANFLYWDGDVMIAHGDRRHQTSGMIEPPGLHVLIRECPPSGAEFEAEGLTVDAAHQRVVLIASVPLTDESWRSFGSGEIVMAADGQLIASTGPK